MRQTVRIDVVVRQTTLGNLVEPAVGQSVVVLALLLSVRDPISHSVRMFMRTNVRYPIRDPVAWMVMRTNIGHSIRRLVAGSFGRTNIGHSISGLVAGSLVRTMIDDSVSRVPIGLCCQSCSRRPQDCDDRG